MSLIIRKATLKDLRDVQNLNHDLFISDSKSDPFLNKDWPYEEAGDTYFRKKISGEKGVCFVAEKDRKVVGYVAGSIRNEMPPYRPIKMAELENIIVKDGERHKGIGEGLVKAFLKYCKEGKVEKVQVSAYSMNSDAIKFYKKEGFEEITVKLEQTP